MEERNAAAAAIVRGSRGRGGARLARPGGRDQRVVVRRYRELGALLAADPPAFVLCHADIHTANIILNPRGEIRIVDWDETVIAPKERDLMFFVR